jgi:hypothetical protein
MTQILHIPESCLGLVALIYRSGQNSWWELASENLHETFHNRQFQLLVYACREGWEVRYHNADYAEKIKIVAV